MMSAGASDCQQEEYEIEGIYNSRMEPTGGGKSVKKFLVKWKGYEGSGAYSWEPECHLKNAKELLANFKLQNRRAELLSPAEASAMPAKRRRRHRSDLKRRHTSASSVDVTPEYREPVRDIQQPPNKRSRHHSKPSLLEKQLQMKHKRKQKLHSNSKEIAAASLQQRQSQDLHRADGPSGRVSTRKAEHQHHQLPHHRGQTGPSLIYVLSNPPLSRLDSVVEAMHGYQAEIAAAKTKESGPPDAQTLRHLVSARGADGNCGNPLALAVALSRTAAADLPLDEPLPEEADASNRGRCLIHLAATAGPHSARLLLLLLSRGANPDATDISRRTALMLAARAGDARAVERLLQFHALPDLRDSGGCSAITLAASAGHWEAVGVLLRHGAEFAGLYRQPGFDPAQLAPWTEQLSGPLLRILRQLRDTRLPRIPANLIAVQPAYLSAVMPGTLCTFTFVTRPCPSRSVHLLVTAAAELDGLGGVRLRRGSGRLLARVTLNGQTFEPVLCHQSLAIYGLQSFIAEPGNENKLTLAFSADCPARTELKLLAQVICVSIQPG